MDLYSWTSPQGQYLLVSMVALEVPGVWGVWVVSFSPLNTSTFFIHSQNKEYRSSVLGSTWSFLSMGVLSLCSPRYCPLVGSWGSALIFPLLPLFPRDFDSALLSAFFPFFSQFVFSFFLLSPVGVLYSLYILKLEALAEKVYLLNYLSFT